VSDLEDIEMEDNGLLEDQDITLVPSSSETPDTFGRNLIMRLGIAPSENAWG